MSSSRFRLNLCLVSDRIGRTPTVRWPGRTRPKRRIAVNGETRQRAFVSIAKFSCAWDGGRHCGALGSIVSHIRFDRHNNNRTCRTTRRALSGSALPAADRIEVTSNASSPSAAVARPRVDRAREFRTVTGAESFSPPCRSSAGAPSGRASPAPCPTEGTRPIGTPMKFGIASNQNGVCRVLYDTSLFCAREQKSAHQEVRGASGEL
jgi:hypothetical protein